MNSYMNITVRVVSAKARAELAKIQASENGVATSATRANTAMSRMGSGPAMSGLVRYGNQLQWVGRQIQYNFTLPIVLAGGLAAKFALDNEKAATRIKKVYGDLSMSTAQVNSETDALRKTFIALSNQYGVAQKDVLNIAADWAAAGSSGVALAKSVGLTLKTMVLGEMEAVQATQALISIQAQYHFSTAELIDTINQLNVIENQTGITLQGLVLGMSRSAGVARMAGVDIRHLGAFLAALTPAAGTATQAGNALKTIFSRLMAPTKAATEVMAQMGINTASMSWQTLTGTQRLEEMAKKFDGLDQSQKNVVATTMASRFQLNRFSVMMDEIHSKLGFYQKALDATSDKEAYFNQATKELNMVLKSNPQRLKQMWVMIQNGMATAIGPLIPYILMAVDAVSQLVQAFLKWPPELRKAIALLLIFLALFGPIIRYVGTTMALIGVLSHYIAKFSKLLWAFGGALVKFFGAIYGVLAKFAPIIGRALLGPWGLALTAAIALALIFHDKVADIWTSIVNFTIRAFNALPQGIQNAMMAVVKIVGAAVIAVYELFSYLNPFAKHSPSLVENVTRGMAVINAQFATLTKIKGPIDQAYADIKRFNAAIAAFRHGMDSIKRAEDLSKIVKVAPGAADEFRALVRDLQALEKILASLTVQIDKQQAVVDKWTAKLKAADDEIKIQQKELDRLQKIADGYSASLDEASAKLDYYANAPIKGMRAMGDAIFANDQAQKKLRLEYMRMEDAVGPVDELRSKLSSLQGEIEMTRSTQAGLRDMGAGSDITGFYDTQIAGLEGQQQAIKDSLKPFDDLQKQMDDLARKGEELDLENSLQFDPLLRQIDQLANGMEELPFDVIISGITQSKAEVDKYSTALDKANAAVDKQQQLVDKLTTQRDNISDRLDSETAKLDVLKGKYDEVNAAIQAINESLSDMVSLADDKLARIKAAQDAAAAKKKAGAAGAKGAKGAGLGQDAQNFVDAAGGDYPIPGGVSKIGREGIKGDQSKLIDEYTQGIQQEMAGFLEKLDLFKPLRKKWAEFITWWDQNVVVPFNRLKEFNTSTLLDWGPVKKAGDVIGAVFRTIEGWAESFWRLFGKDVIQIWDELREKATYAWESINPELERFSRLLEPLGKALGRVWNILKPVLELIGGALLLQIKITASVLSNVFGRALGVIINIIGDVMQVIRGFIEFLVGLISGDWALAWQGLKDVVSGTFQAIWHIIEGAASILFGIVSGIVEGIVDFFVWLWDELVGHSIIPDMIDAIVDFFKGLPVRLWNALKDLVSSVTSRFVDLAVAIGTWFVDTGKDFVDWFTSLPGKAWNALKNLASKVLEKFTDTWNAWVTWRNNFYSNFWDWFTSLPGKAWNALSELASKIKSRFVDVATAVYDWAFGKGGWFGKVVSWFADLPGDILNGMKNGANALLRGLTNIFNGIGQAAIGGINIAIRAINGLIDAMNWIADKVPVLSFHIDPVPERVFKPFPAPQFAEGGILPKSVGGGFATNRARAIVGEGGPHPEFVIPTDPAHRKNAVSLINQAAKTLGLEDAGGPWDFIKNAASAVGSLIKEGALKLMFEPIDAIAQGLISTLPKFMNIKGGAQYYYGQIKDWILGADANLSAKWQRPVNAGLTLGYGNTYSDGSFHSGIDFGVGVGTPVKAAGSGKLMASYDIPGTSPYNNYPYASYGRVVQIEHDKGISTLYAHLSERLVTKIGQAISAGDVIAKSGTTGNSTGPHLHFEVRRGGTPVNPMEFLKSQGVNFDSGGWLKAGQTLTNNETGSPEPVFSASQWATLDRATNVSMSLVATLPDAIKSAVATAQDGNAARLAGRATAAADARTDTLTAGATTEITINIYGDLSFPDISNGDDAKKFITNLKALAVK